MGKFGWSYPPGAENDPFAPYNQADEWGMDMDELRDALSAHDSGRWDWDRIDCCLSGTENLFGASLASRAYMRSGNMTRWKNENAKCKNP